MLSLLYKENHEGVVFPSSQLEFRRLKSTLNATSTLLDHVRLPSKHSLVIFIDISGGFDNLCWPGLLFLLHDKGIPRALTNIIKNYLTYR